MTIETAKIVSILIDRREKAQKSLDAVKGAQSDLSLCLKVKNGVFGHEFYPIAEFDLVMEEMKVAATYALEGRIALIDEEIKSLK